MDNREDISTIHVPDSEPFLPINALRSDHSTELLLVRGRLEDKQVRILIDGGARGNFMSMALGKEMGLGRRRGEKRTVTIADSTTNDCFKVEGLTLKVDDHMEMIDVYQAPIVHDLILGKPWLALRNPEIDWRKNRLSFTTDDGQTHQWWATYYPPRDKSTILDDALSAKQLEKMVKLNTTDLDLKFFLCVLTNKDLDEFHGAVDQAMADKPEYLRKVLLDFDDVFSGVTGLPPQRPHDHRIDTVPGSEPPFRSIYHMSPKELDQLKDELDQILKLDHIRAISLPFWSTHFLCRRKDREDSDGH